MHSFFSCWGGVRASGLRTPAMLILLACLVTGLFGASSAHAHAALVAAEPAQGSTLPSAPDSIELRFNEPVSPLVLKLLTPDGKTLLLDEVRQQDQRLRLALPALQAQGSYVLSWRVVSGDGHPVGGSLLFAVGAASEVAALAPAENRARQAALWSVRVLVYLGLFLGVGGVVFRVFLTPLQDGPSKAVGTGQGHAWLWLGAVATLLSLCLFGLDALDAPFSAWSQSAVWQAAWTSTVGRAALLTWLALGLAGLAGYFRARQTTWARCNAAAALLLVGGALASSGHASLAAPSWLARPAVWLHAMAVAFWIGSLLPLRSSLRSPSMEAALSPLARFSQAIPWGVAVLAMSGIVLACLQLGRLEALWRTPYGQVLLWKLGLVMTLLALGAWNRYRLTPAALHGEVRARRRLRQVIGLEVGIALLILGVAALWRFTPPPRSLPAGTLPLENIRGESLPFSVHLHAPATMVQLQFAPAANAQGRALEIQVSDAAGAPLAVQAVEVVFAHAENAIEPISYEATRLEQGRWQIPSLQLPAFSGWQVQVRLLVSDFDRLTLQTDFVFPSSMESQ